MYFDLSKKVVFVMYLLKYHHFSWLKERWVISLPRLRHVFRMGNRGIFYFSLQKLKLLAIAKIPQFPQTETLNQIVI